MIDLMPRGGIEIFLAIIGLIGTGLALYGIKANEPMTGTGGTFLATLGFALVSFTGLSGSAWAFGIIAGIILSGAYFSAVADRTFHSALGLGQSLVGVAMLYILLNAPFIGVIQILVYVGGILTLLVFAVMFVAGDEEEVDDVPEIGGAL